MSAAVSTFARVIAGIVLGLLCLVALTAGLICDLLNSPEKSRAIDRRRGTADAFAASLQRALHLDGEHT